MAWPCSVGEGNCEQLWGLASRNDDQPRNLTTHAKYCAISTAFLPLLKVCLDRKYEHDGFGYDCREETMYLRVIEPWTVQRAPSLRLRFRGVLTNPTKNIHSHTDT